LSQLFPPNFFQTPCHSYARSAEESALSGKHHRPVRKVWPRHVRIPQEVCPPLFSSCGDLRSQASTENCHPEDPTVFSRARDLARIVSALLALRGLAHSFWRRQVPGQTEQNRAGTAENIAEKLDSRTKTFVSERLRCCVRRRERAGLAGPRSGQDTINAALKAPLFHSTQWLRSARHLSNRTRTAAKTPPPAAPPNAHRIHCVHR
jgi:hypothetical protein